MLLFIGGAARTGKGMLARRLLAELQLPYLSIDVLKMGLTRGVPEYAIDPNAGGLVVGERLWPLVRELYARLPMPRLALDNSAGAWAEDERRALVFLGLSD